MTVLRVCYRHGIRFDESYYKATHLPLAGSVLGPYGVKHIEMVKIASAPDGSAPTYQVMFSAYFDSADALQKAMQDPRNADVMADVRNFFDGAPEVMIGEVVVLN